LDNFKGDEGQVDSRKSLVFAENAKDIADKVGGGVKLKRKFFHSKNQQTRFVLMNARRKKNSGGGGEQRSQGSADV